MNPENPPSPTSELSDGLDNRGSVSPVVLETPRNSTGASISIQTPIQRRIIIEDDTMLYAYPKYSKPLDTAAHIKQFKSIWAVNHGT
jgi:hypothetical protein